MRNVAEPAGTTDVALDGFPNIDAVGTGDEGGGTGDETGATGDGPLIFTFSTSLETIAIRGRDLLLAGIVSDTTTDIGRGGSGSDCENTGTANIETMAQAQKMCFFILQKLRLFYGDRATAGYEGPAHIQIRIFSYTLSNKIAIFITSTTKRYIRLAFKADTELQ